MSTAAPAASVPSLWVRVAAMVYELVLLFGVVFVTGLGLLAVARWTYPLAPAQRGILQAVLFVAVGFYFAYCWSRGGQTLAMKSWGLQVVGADGRSLSFGRALLRYLLAWHLLLPSILVVTLMQTRALVDLFAFVLVFALMLLTVYLDPQRQFLHDRWLRTRVIRVPTR